MKSNEKEPTSDMYHNLYILYQIIYLQTEFCTYYTHYIININDIYTLYKCNKTTKTELIFSMNEKSHF